MRVFHRLTLLLCGVLAAGLSGPLCAQTVATSEITGAVVDSTRRVVTGATVQLKNVDTGESTLVQSNDSGMYRFALVKPGVYEISAKSEGLRSDIGRLLAAVGQVQSIELQLKLEEPRTAVVVNDAAPLLNTENAHVVYTVSSRQLELVPLPGGDLTAAAYLAPGTVINSRIANYSGFGNFASGGTGGVSNLFTVNGMDNMDPYFNANNSGTSGLMLGANEVREATVVQNAYEGHYGRQAGAQVNYVTKTGGNTYHGNLLYDYNATLLNANDFFANATGTPRPHEVANQYAASAGGRIARDKVFFFTDTEGLRFAVPGSLPAVTTPSPELQSYALRIIQPSQVSLYQKMFGFYNNAPGHERAVRVVNGNGPVEDSSGRLGCGRLAGTPTGTGGVFGTNVSCAQAWLMYIPWQTSQWLLSERVDYNLSANQRLFFRFRTDQGYAPAQINVISPVFNAVNQRPDYIGQLGDTLVITPRLVNSLIASVSYNSSIYDIADRAAALQGFPFRINFRDGGANFGAIASIGPPAMYPQGRHAGQLQLIDDISYTIGAHTIKAGVNHRYNRVADVQWANFMNGVFALRRLTDFASGTLNTNTNSSYQQNFSLNSVLHVRLYNTAIYIQDHWGITSRLKLTVAVRLDRTGNPYCIDRCFSRLTGPFTDLNKGLTVPYNRSIETLTSHAFYATDAVLPQPRFSLAYNPGSLPRSVIRGGIGLFSDLYPSFVAGAMGGNPPNVFASMISTGLISAGGNGSAPAISAASAEAFATGFATGATLPELQEAVAPSTFVTPSLYSMPGTVKSPKYLEWSLEVQHQFAQSSVSSVRYAGNHGYDVFRPNQNMNANADPALFPNGFAGLPAAPPDPRFSSVWGLTNAGYSNYHAFTAEFRQALSHGFQGHVSYTWSHALDTLSNGGLLNFGYDSVRTELGPLNYSHADYDVRHNLAADFIWDVPLNSGHTWIKRVFFGWSVAGKLSAHSGTPFSVVNQSIAGLTGSPTVLADVVDTNIQTDCGRASVDQPCFTTTQFIPAGKQTDLGNRPRNSFRGPGWLGADASVLKSVPLREHISLAFGISAYNVLNHPNFLDPNFLLGYPGFGLVTGTAINPSGPYGFEGGPSGRAMVIRAKLVF